MSPSNEQFMQAASEWDLATLYTDLASAKGKHLTPMEKLHLRGLLCGHSPAEIAEKLGKNVKGVEVDLCSTLYQYVKNLVGKSNGKVDNWRNITEWIEDSGYKIHSQNKYQSSDCLSVKFVIKRANIVLERNNIVVDLNMQIVAPAPLDRIEIEEDLAQDDRTTLPLVD
jgi:hypothetical protein